MATLQVASVRIQHTDIGAMFSTPKALVAPPGPTKVIVPWYAKLGVNTVAGAYGSGGNIVLTESVVNSGFGTLAGAGALTAAQRTVTFQSAFAAALGSLLFENAALYIGNQAGAFTGGNVANFLDVVVYYTIEDWAPTS